MEGLKKPTTGRAGSQASGVLADGLELERVERRARNQFCVLDAREQEDRREAEEQPCSPPPRNSCQERIAPAESILLLLKTTCTGTIFL